MTNNLTTQSSVPSTIPTSTKIATEDLGDNNGHAQIVKAIFDPSNLSAFGTLEVAPMTPVLQMDFVHGINTQSGVSTIANSGVVDTDSGRLRLQSGTIAGGGATITSGNSIASYDVAGTTVTSGTYIFGVGVDNPNSQIIDLTPFNIFIAPGETLTISGFSTNSAAMQVAINWTEDL